MCSTVIVAACGGNSQPTDAGQQATAPAAPASAKKAPAADDQISRMVTAVGMVKSTVPVALKFGLGARPAVGAPLAIDIALLPQISADSAIIQVADADGLDTSAVGAGLPFDKLAAGGSYRRSISVTPTRAGVLLLDLTVNIKHDEITESRAFSVPIIVAETAPPAHGS